MMRRRIAQQDRLSAARKQSLGNGHRQIRNISRRFNWSGHIFFSCHCLCNRSQRLAPIGWIKQKLILDGHGPCIRITQ